MNLTSLLPQTKAFILGNRAAIDVVLAKSEQSLKGLGKANNTYSFDEILKQYNKGITQYDIKAWVIYKSYVMKEPMEGDWKKVWTFKNEKALFGELLELMLNEAIFYCEGQYLPYAVYTYCNVYDRETQLKVDKDFIIEEYGQEAYEIHQKALLYLRQNVVKELSFSNPDPKLRPKLLCYAEFSIQFYIDRFVVDGEEYSIRDSGKHNLKYAFGEWLDVVRNKAEYAKLFSTVSAYAVKKHYVYNMKFTGGNEEERNILASNCSTVGEAAFDIFLYEGLHIDDQQRLTITWNAEKSGWTNVQYDRVPVGFICSSKFKLGDFVFSNAQREAIAFLLVAQNGLIAYDVGVGKTISAIIFLANEMYRGKIKRPLLVVPKPVYEKWKNEIFGYEDAGKQRFGVMSGLDNITLNDWYNLGKDVEKPLNKKIKDGTITIVTYQGFEQIGFSDKVAEDLFEELSHVFAKDSQNARDKVKEILSFQEKMGKNQKGTFLNFDELGFDSIVIDEAHNGKKVFTVIPNNRYEENGRKRYNIKSEASARGLRMFIAAFYLQNKVNGNVTLLTATPFTNNPLEVYTMLSMVVWKKMRDYGISSVASFCEDYISEKVEFVITPGGEVKLKSVMKSFNNKVALQKLLFAFMNYKTGEDAQTVRPNKLNIPKLYEIDKATGIRIKLIKEKQIASFLQMSETQEENQAYINQSLNDPESLRELFRALAQSLNNAISPFLCEYNSEPIEDYKQFVEKSPKIHYAIECIRSVKRWHESRKEEMSGQVIYMNRGKECFGYIKEYLHRELKLKSKVAFGKNKVDEVEIIDSSVTEDRREVIKDAFLNNIVKVIIGTSSIREGIDLQTNGTVLYNLTPDWNPTDMKQLEGRIWRQGNRYANVRIVTPLVQDTMDTFIYQKLDEKTQRVNDLWDKGDGTNSMTIEGLDPDEMKIALLTDIRLLAYTLISKEQTEVKQNIGALEGKVKKLHEINGSITSLKEKKDVVIKALPSMKANLADFENFIKYSPDRWKYETEAYIEEKKAKAKEVAHEIGLLIANPPYDEKQIMGIIAQVKGSVFDTRGVVDIPYEFDEFKRAFLTVEQAKKTTFQKENINNQEDILKLIEQIEESLKEHKDRLEAMKSPEYALQVAEKIRKRKEENKVEGLDAIAATEDFKDTNWMLGVYANSNDKAIAKEVSDTEKEDLYQYPKLGKAATETFNQLREICLSRFFPSSDESEDSPNTKIDNTKGTFMPLSIERTTAYGSWEYWTLAHYYEQNGDLMSDPCMTFIVHKNDKNVVYPESFQQDGTPAGTIYETSMDMKLVGKDYEIKPTKKLNDHIKFANLWLKNIENQQDIAKMYAKIIQKNADEKSTKAEGRDEKSAKIDSNKAQKLSLKLKLAAAASASARARNSPTGMSGFSGTSEFKKMELQTKLLSSALKLGYHKSKNKI